MALKLSEELTEFIESGVSTIVGTRDAALRPCVMRASGAFVSEDREHLTVFLNQALAARTRQNLAQTGWIATTFSRPIDHRTLQVKGRVVELRPARAAERARIERYLAAFVEQLYCVGLPRALVRRLRVWPSLAVVIEATDVFSQTPGPGAGARIAG